MDTRKVFLQKLRVIKKLELEANITKSIIGKVNNDNVLRKKIEKIQTFHWGGQPSNESDGLQEEEKS